MQILSQNRSVTRVTILVFMTAAMIIGSWRLAAGRALPSSLDDVNAYLAESASRTSASSDAQIDGLQERLRTNPDDWQAYSQLGHAYLQKARETGDPSYYQKTEQALDRALALEPGDYAATSGKGALALARHEFHSALEWGERAVQINPDRAYAYGVIADAQIELGRYEAAIETLQTMVNLRPDMSSYSRISYVRELHGDIEGALEMMQAAVDSGVPGAENTAWVRTQLANLYFNTGDLARAEVEYQRTLRDRPDYVYAMAGLGRVRAAQGNTDEAIRLLTQAVTLMPLPEFVITLGELYQAAGQQAAADEQYELVEVIEQLHRANGVDMDMEIALFHADRGQRLEETVRLARQAYASRPGIHAADVLAWALYKTGQYEEAQQYSDEALQLGTQDALKLFHAGMIALELGEESRAREYLEQALAINPHFSILYAGEARRTLQALQAAE
ncbi:MAG TPA: tetratricopeptide repeat protein [Anaerolineales bacterium]|nr:tetratricopeptide repeat protein [Anaerolineales bacterium]